MKNALRALAGVAIAVVCAVGGDVAAASPDPAASLRGAPEVLDPATPDAAAIAATGSGSCTGWRNTILPPPTIRVYREAYGPLEGTVEIVDLRTWTEQVLRTQMPSFYPTEALRANAIAVKQYGWYYTVAYRGGVAPDGLCYDVKDTGDGFYRPEVYTPAPQQIAAVDATWPFTVRKYDYPRRTSRFFPTGYRAGSSTVCGAEKDGFHLFQHGAFGCAKDGMTWEGILRVFLEPKLEIVDPGVHDLVGSIRGDAGVMDTSSSDVLVPRTYASTGKVFQAAPTSTTAIPTKGLQALETADVTGDRLDDIVGLVDSPAGRRIRVWAANGTGYDPPESWWIDHDAITDPSTRLLSGDFDGDGIADIALFVGPTIAGGDTTLYVLPSTGAGLAAPQAWWSGQLDLGGVTVQTGDATGDGRSDVILQRALGTGMEFLVMASRLKGGALDAPVRWVYVSGLQPATTRSVVADAGRDGRDDVYLAYPATTGTTVALLRATSASTFTRRILWTSPATDPLPFQNLRLGTGDYDLDGRGDLLMLIDRGAKGSRMQVFLPNDGAGTVAVWYDDPSLDWANARPY